MNRRQIISFVIATSVTAACWIAISSVVFVWGVGLLPAYRVAGRVRASIMWAWLAYLGYDGVRADVAQRWLEIGAVSPAVLGGALWLLWRRFRPQQDRPLYGETQPADRAEMQESGLALKRKL